MKGIDKSTIFFLLIVFIGWGVSVFFDKLAANRLGTRGLSIYLLSFIPAVITVLYFLIWGYKGGYDRIGVLWAALSFILNLVALVGYYLLFTKTEASWAVAVTALYPVLTIILAFIFLKETITLTKVIGIILATAALVFLSL